MRKRVQGMIKMMSSSSVSGCALALVNLQQWLEDRAKWIYGWIGHLIVNEALEEILRDHPNLHKTRETRTIDHTLAILKHSILEVHI